MHWIYLPDRETYLNLEHARSVHYHPGRVSDEDDYNDEGTPVGTVIPSTCVIRWHAGRSEYDDNQTTHTGSEADYIAGRVHLLANDGA